MISGWIAAIGGLLVIVSTLAAAVAVYRTQLTSTSLKEARATIEDLRGEVGDHERRERRLETEMQLEKVALQTCRDRVKVLEDLLTRRQDDEALRGEIAAVRQVVDQNVMSQLTAIHQLLQDGARR